MLDVPEPTVRALERVEETIQVQLDDGTRIGRTALTTFDAGGKRLRPLLLLLSCQSAGGRVTQQVVRAAAAVEIIHTASLVHDDIMDEAELRRGSPTVYKAEGIAGAITIGDYLFVKGYGLAARTMDDVLVRIVVDACSGLAEGQYMEERLKQNPTDSDLYLYVVERKTAGFIAGCAEVGARLAGLDQKACRPYHDFGFNLGVAFQLIDDVLDATGSVDKLGKDVGLDVRNGAKGGPAVLAGKLSGRLAAMVHDVAGPEEGVDRTRRLAERFAASAREAAGLFPDNAFSRTLADVASVLLTRET